MMLLHGDDTTSGNFLQNRPENGFAPLSLELLPSHLQRAQLHAGVVLGWSRVGRGRGVAVASPPLTCGRCSWVLGAGARGSMDSGEARRGVRNAGAGASAAAAPSAQHGPGTLWRPGQPCGVPPQLSGPGARVCAVHPRDWGPALRPLQCRKGQRQPLKEQSLGPAQPPFLSREPSFPQVLGLTPAAATFLRPCGEAGGGTARYRVPATPSAELF